MKVESIGRELLRRELSLLLRLYAIDLQIAAGGNLQNLVGRSVLYGSRYISADIITMCDLECRPSDLKTSALSDETRRAKLKEFLQSLHESNSGDKGNIAPSLDTLEDVQEISGPAFNHLKENL